MNGSAVDVRVYFRFNNLNKLQAYTLKKEVVGSSFKELNDGCAFAGYVPLNEESIHEVNDFYVRQIVKIDECDILVSVVSKNDSNSVSVPRIVNQMLKYIDCGLTFSHAAE